MSDVIQNDRIAPAATDASSRTGVLTAFTAAMFVSAFLLFSAEPLLSSLILPRLGGSPAVWNTCVFFFQTALLAGYCYTHLSTARLRPREQLALHGLVLIGAMLLMPLSLGTEAPAPGQSPALWLLRLLLFKVGLPFGAVAATAPLLQIWFARSGHPDAKDPYFLYAASNAGSLTALLGYPLVVGTSFDLNAQSVLWSLGFGALAMLVLALGLGVVRVVTTVPRARAAIAAPRWRERLRWVVLAFVPSALMLAVTTHVTSDVVAVPLFWVLPLAIYIATFIIAFGRYAGRWRGPLLAAQAVALIAAALTGFEGTSTPVAMLLPVLAFSLTAWVCHAELADRRPSVEHLTSFYLYLALGGALGGMFAALLAPALFPVPLEYPLLLVAACLLRPQPAPDEKGAAALLADILLPAVMTLAALLLLSSDTPIGRAEAAGLCTVAMILFARRRVRLALALSACLFGPMLIDAGMTDATARNFFGVLRVKRLPQSELVSLQHGTTVHGVESLRPGETLEPLGYYRRTGPFGRFFATAADAPRDVGVLGLGVGSLACYARAGDHWTFYEINPEVERLAADTRYFQFLKGCGRGLRFVQGDARLALDREPSAQYDVLIVDTFSSDSIPMHLITREAMALYISRLKPGGVLLFHVTNRYLDLVPVVARLAADAGASVRHLLVPPGPDQFREPRTEVLAISRNEPALDRLAADGWDVPQPGEVLWTDQRSSILAALKW